MELKKYLSFDGLNKYDSLIKMRTDEKLSDKQNKDFIVEFADDSNTTVTKSVAEIATAVESGTHVKFFDGGEYLDLLGCSTADNFALFYAAYCIGGEWNIKTCAIVGTSVMENVTEKYNYATKDAIDTKADAEHTHTYESIVGLEDAIGEVADSKFYVVTFDKGSDGEYHADLTFAEIREKFEAGGNMVARIDGTDYIPLLSAATHQIIFSGIYQAQSVSLTINASDVCTLTTTSLTKNDSFFGHTGNKSNPHNVTAEQIGAADAKAVDDALAGKSDVSHNHDEMYYTETEIDAKLTEAKDYADNAAKTALEETVRFTEQTLTEEQKAQAKSNLGIVEGTSSWNDLTDKPTTVSGGDTLTWDGNTEGLESVSPGEGYPTLYRISSAIPTKEDCTNGVDVVYGDGTTDHLTNVFDVDGVGLFNVIYVFPEDNYVLDGVTIPKAGCWAMNIDGYYISSLTIPGYTGFTKEVLKPEVLPEHSHKWDDIEDKPFGETPTGGDTLTWDGNTDGLVCFADIGSPLYKISDATPTENDINEDTKCALSHGIIIGRDGLVQETLNGCIIGADGLFMVVPNDNCVLDLGDGNIINMPQKGVYFGIYNNCYITSLTIPGYTGFPVVKKIDPKYLPDDIGGGEGGSINIDTTLSVSGSAADAKAVGDALANKQDKLTFDSTPTRGSSNPVISGGLFDKFTEQDENINMASMTANMAMPGSLTWDGVVGDRERVIVEEGQIAEGVTMRVQLVHVSDYVPEMLSLMMNGVPAEERILTALRSMSGLDVGAANEVETIQVQVADDMFIMGNEFFYVPTDGYSMEGITFSKKGWYFANYSYCMGDLEASLMYTSGIKLDGITFPDNSGGDADKYFETKTVTRYVGDTLTWDGNIDGRVYAEKELGSGSSTTVVRFVKISDSILTKEHFLNGLSYTMSNGANIELSYEDLTSGAAFHEDGSLSTDGVRVIPYDDYPYTENDITIVFPEAGTYLIWGQENTDTIYVTSCTVPNYDFTIESSATHKVIKTEHLPKALQFGEIEKTVGGDTLTWDGNTEGLISVVFSDGVIACKISDSIPKAADFVSGSLVTATFYSNGQTQTYTIPDSFRNEFTDDGFAAFDSFTIVPTDNYTYTNVEPIVFPKSGTYLLADADMYISSITLNGYTGFETTVTETVKIDPKYLHQPDWNQTDEAAADFIKNKPFGDELVELFAETEVTGEVNDDGIAASYDTSRFTGNEKTLTITFDGVPFTCSVYQMQDMLIFGNLAMMGMGQDSGEPFCSMVAGDGTGVFAMPDTETHTVEIVEVKTVKIDEKYVNAIKAVYTDGSGYLYSDIGCTTKVAKMDLYAEAHKKSLSIQLVANGTVLQVITPLQANFIGECATVTAYAGGQFQNFYTAEYTPEA